MTPGCVCGYAYFLRYSQALRPTGFCVPTEVPYSLKEGFPAWTLALGINFGDRWDSQAKCKCKLEQPAEASFTLSELSDFTRDMLIGGADGQSSKTVDCTAAEFRMPTFVVEGMYNPNLAARTVLFDLEFVNKTDYHAMDSKKNGLNEVEAIDYRRSILVGDTLKPNVACDGDTKPDRRPSWSTDKCKSTDAAYSSGYGNLYKDKDNEDGIKVKGGLAQINIRKCEKTQTIADDVPEDDQGQNCYAGTLDPDNPSYSGFQFEMILRPSCCIANDRFNPNSEDPDRCSVFSSAPFNQAAFNDVKNAFEASQVSTDSQFGGGGTSTSKTALDWKRGEAYGKLLTENGNDATKAQLALVATYLQAPLHPPLLLLPPCPLSPNPTPLPPSVARPLASTPHPRPFRIA